MTCERIEPLLYLKPEERSQGEQRQIDEHLKQCDSCKRLEAHIMASAARIKQLASLQMEADTQSLVGSLMSKVTNEKQQEKEQNAHAGPGDKVLKVFKWGFSVAALFFAGIFLIQLLLWNGQGQTIHKPEMAATVSKQKVMEFLPDYRPTRSSDLEKWAKQLVVENKASRPIEKLIFEKYKQDIMNHFVVNK